jgi:hypothetical protein
VTRVRWSRSALLAVALLGLTTTAGVVDTPAHAETLPAPTVTTTSAPDGVYVDWDNVNPDGGYRLHRTVDGSTTSVFVYASHYGDKDLLPGQEATYVVEAYSGSSPTGDASAPTSGRRSAEGWSAPDGAKTAAVFGTVHVDTNAVFYSDPPLMGSDELTHFGIAFSRIPHAGTFALSASAAPDKIQFDSVVGCGGPYPSGLQGTVTAYDVVYGAAGTPLQLGADFAWTCANGLQRRASVRVASPQPYAYVVALKPTRTTVEAGKSAIATWRLENRGSLAASITGAEVSKGTVDDTACTTTELAPGTSCNLGVTLPGEGEQVYYYSLIVDVDAQPSAGGSGDFSVVPPLAPPTVRLDGRLPHAAELRWEGGAPGVGELLAYRVERLAVDGSWQIVGEATGYTWTARNLRPGEEATYRVSVVNSENQVSEPSAPVSVTTPAEGVLWFGSEVRGGSNASDRGSVSVIPSLSVQHAPLLTTGVDVSPDRRHIAVTTVSRISDVNSLMLTDLDGSNEQVLFSVPNSNWERLIGWPRFSPDGRRVLLSFGSEPAVVDIASKTLTSLGFHTGEPAGWSPDGTRILLRGGYLPTGEPDTGLRWGLTTHAAVSRLAGTVNANSAPDVSRTGAVVFSVQTSPNQGELRIIPPQGGLPVTVWKPSGCSVWTPRFDPTGTRVLVYAGGSDAAGSGCALGTNGRFVLTLPAAGPVTDVRLMVSQSAVRASSPTVWEVPTTLPPTATVTVAAFTGTTATATITAADPDDAVGGLTRQCRLDAGPWTPCGATWVGSKLAAGRHQLAAKVTDPAGNASPIVSASWTVDTAAPTVSVTQPTSPLFGTALTLRWAGSDTAGAGVASYDVRYRYASPYGGFSAYSQPAAWQGLRTTTLTHNLSQGYTYCYQVRSRDKVGNLGTWSAERCVVSVLDDRALTVSTGVVRGTSSAYTYGTYSRAAALRKTFSRTGVQARRLAVVVTTCPTCGSIDVTHAGVYLGRISLTSTTTAAKQVRWLPLQSVTRTGTVTLRTLNTRLVYVDGLVVQH